MPVSSFPPSKLLSSRCPAALSVPSVCRSVPPSKALTVLAAVASWEDQGPCCSATLAPNHRFTHHALSLCTLLEQHVHTHTPYQCEPFPHVHAPAHVPVQEKDRGRPRGTSPFSKLRPQVPHHFPTPVPPPSGRPFWLLQLTSISLG